VLLDEFRNDVTPRSLLMEGQEIGVTIAAAGARAHAGVGTEGPLDDSFDDAASVGGFSTGGLSARSGGTEDDDHDERAGASAADGAHSGAAAVASSLAADADRWDRRRSVVHEDLSRPVAAPAGSGRTDLPTAAQAAQAGLLDEELDVELSETDTTTALWLPSLLVPAGTPAAEAVSAEAAGYAALGQAVAKGGDAYSGKHSQTAHAGRKNKSSLARPPRSAEAGSQATAWAVVEEARLEAAGDAWADSGAVAGAAVGAAAGADTLEGQVQGVVAASLTAPGATLEAEDAVVIGPALERGSSVDALRVPGTRRRRDPARVAVMVSAARGKGAAGRPGADAGAGRGGGTGVGLSASSVDESGLHSTSMGESSARPLESTTAGGAAAAAAAAAMARAARPAGGDGVAFDEAVRADPNLMDAVTRKQAERVIRGPESGRLLASMRAVERVLVQARHHAAHRLYRVPAGSGQAAALAAELEAEAAGPAARAAAGAKGRAGEEEEEEAAAGKDRRRVGFSAEADGSDDGSAGASAGDEEERLAELWTYESAEVEAAGLAVTDAAWSPATPSVLAVSYGPPRYSAESRGCLCLWSMKNPSNPAVHCWVPVGVTSLSYSAAAPTLLAAGLYDGRVAVFDTKRLLSSARTGGTGAGGLRPDALSDGLQPGCHTEAVWQVGWVERPNGRGERLVSVSTDGRVNEWSATKGLECHTIMQLRAARAGSGEAGAEDGDPSGKAAAAAIPAAAVERGAGRGMAESAGGLSQRAVSRGASGLCFTFMPPPLDVTKYLVGTEDGFLHTCSVSYAAQYLSSRKVHDGPTNRVRLSPVDPLVCLTCGADWTVKLWALGDEVDLLRTFTAEDCEAAVVDVAWSPQLPGRFVSVTEGGHLMVWEADTLAPVIAQRFTEQVTVVTELATAVAAGGGGSNGAVATLLGRGPKVAAAGDASAAATRAAEDDEDDEDDDAAARRRSRAAAAAAAAAVRTVSRPRRFTCVAMAPGVPVLAAGDASGRVSVFRLVGSPAPPATAGEAAMELEARLFGGDEEEER